MPRKSTNKDKALRNTARPDRPENKKIAATPVAPEPDAGLDSIAQTEWKRVTKEMATHGLITSLDAAVLAAYATNFSRWKRAEAAVAIHGEILFTSVRDTHQRVTHEKPMKNPMLSVSEGAQRLMSRFADQLGLSPSGRSKLGLEHTEPEGEDVMAGLDAVNKSLENFK